MVNPLVFSSRSLRPGLVDLRPVVGGLVHLPVDLPVDGKEESRHDAVVVSYLYPLVLI